MLASSEYNVPVSRSREVRSISVVGTSRICPGQRTSTVEVLNMSGLYAPGSAEGYIHESVWAHTVMVMSF